MGGVPLILAEDDAADSASSQELGLVKSNGVLLKPRFDFFSSPPEKGVLLLQQLTKSNAAIQKIVAFENAFERLLDIITEEGNSDGGTVESKT